MKLNLEEKIFIDTVSAISGKDTKIVKEIFDAIVVATTMDIYAGKKTLSFPYLFSVDIDPKRTPIPKGFKIDCNYRLRSNRGLQDSVNKIMQGSKTEAETYIKQEIEKHISEILAD